MIKLLLLKKNKKLFSILYYNNINKFHAFKIKNDFENVQENGEFRFENDLKDSICSAVECLLLSNCVLQDNVLSVRNVISPYSNNN